VEQFGKLLLHGVHTVVTGKPDQAKDVRFWNPTSNPRSPHTDSARNSRSIADLNDYTQYEIYLFECILLCCKEVVPNKIKDKKEKTKSAGPKIRNKNAKLQLKGRIFMTNVTDVVAISKPGKCFERESEAPAPSMLILRALQDPTRFKFGGRAIRPLRTL